MMRSTLGLLLLFLATSAIPTSADPVDPDITFVVQVADMNATDSYSGTIGFIAQGVNGGGAFNTLLSATLYSVLAGGTTAFTVTDTVPAGTTSFYVTNNSTDQNGVPVYLFAQGVTPPSDPADIPMTQNALIENTIDAANNYPQVEHDGYFQIGEVTIYATVTPTPEPGTAGLILIGVGLLGLMTVIQKRDSRGHQQAI